METWTQRIERYIAEGRTVSGGKQDKTLQANEKAQNAFSQQLMQLFSQRFGQQSPILDFLTKKLTATAENPQGFSPQTRAALQGRAADTTAAQFSNAEKSLQANQAARGDFGGQAKSGVNAQLDAQLRAAGAAQLSGELGDIQLQDEQLKQQNYWRAIAGLSDTSQQLNPTQFAGAAVGGGSALAGMANVNLEGQKSGFGAQLSGSFASALGKTLGGGNISMTKAL